VEANGVDVGLMALEALHALARANVPNKGVPVGTARDEDVARVRLWDVHGKNCTKIKSTDQGIGGLTVAKMAMEILDHLAAFHIPLERGLFRIDITIWTCHGTSGIATAGQQLNPRGIQKPRKRKTRLSERMNVQQLM